MNRRAIALSVCGAVATWHGGEPASACQEVPLGVSPWGDSLPTRGALYLDARRSTPRDIMVTSLDIRWSLMRIDDRTVRIDYDAGSATTLSVYVPRLEKTWDFHLDAAWRPPATAPHMVQVWRRSTTADWCGGEDGLWFQVDQPVMAMHVTVLSSTGARLDRTLLPQPLRGATGDGTGVVRLDPADDTGRAILADAWLAHLRAVNADGSEVDVGGSPFAVGPEFVPIASDIPFDTVGLVPVPPAPLAVAPTPPAPAHKATPLLTAVLGLLLAAGALSWRLRVRPPPVPRP